MKLTGEIKDSYLNAYTGETMLTLAINERDLLYGEYDAMQGRPLDISLNIHRKARSKDANALMWSCIGEIAKAMHPPMDKWDVYLQMLKRYGKYSYVYIKSNAVDAFRAGWRESEVVGEVGEGDNKFTQMLVYYGSHLYDTKEFAILLDGVISEMVEIGLTPPPSEEMRRLLEHEINNTERR